LKQLVKQNFERFISCKTTIDDIYTKLHRIESTQTGLSTEVLYKAIQEVRRREFVSACPGLSCFLSARNDHLLSSRSPCLHGSAPGHARSGSTLVPPTRKGQLTRLALTTVSEVQEGAGGLSGLHCTHTCHDSQHCKTHAMSCRASPPSPIPLQVQDGAGDVFGPSLQRSAQAERIRSVQLLLKRFGGLFSAPQRVTALGAARDYEQVIAVNVFMSVAPSAPGTIFCCILSEGP
jgi:hypothetical protein